MGLFEVGGEASPEVTQCLAAFRIGYARRQLLKILLPVLIDGPGWWEGHRLRWRRLNRLQLPAEVRYRCILQMLIDPRQQIGFDKLKVVHPGGILHKDPQDIPAKKSRGGQPGNLGTDNGRPFLNQTEQAPGAGPLLQRIDLRKYGEHGQ